MNELVKLGVGLYKGVATEKFSKYDANEAIRNGFIKILGTDKPDHKTFRRHKVAIFEIIEEVLEQTITNGMVATDFFNQFVEYKDLNLGDTNEFFVEDNTMLTVARVSGNHWDIRRQKLNEGDSFSVPVEAYAVGVYGDFLRFLAGRLDWVALMGKIERAFVHDLNSRIHAAFMGSVSYLPTEFKQTGTYDEEKLLTIAEHVQAANQGSNLIIAGTRTALSKILKDSSLMSDGMKDELNKSGYISDWNGYSVMAIPQSHKPNTFEFEIENNKLLVLPSNAKPVKVVREGTPIIRENSDGTVNKDMSMEHDVISFYGVGVIFNTLYGMYDLS